MTRPRPGPPYPDPTDGLLGESETDVARRLDDDQAAREQATARGFHACEECGLEVPPAGLLKLGAWFCNVECYDRWFNS